MVFLWASDCPRLDESHLHHPLAPSLASVRLFLRCFHSAALRQKWRPHARPELPLLAPRPCTHTRPPPLVSSSSSSDGLPSLPSFLFPSLPFSWSLNPNRSPFSSPPVERTSMRRGSQQNLLLSTYSALALESGRPAGNLCPAVRARAQILRENHPSRRRASYVLYIQLNTQARQHTHSYCIPTSELIIIQAELQSDATAGAATGLGIITLNLEISMISNSSSNRTEIHHAGSEPTAAHHRRPPAIHTLIYI